MRFTKTGLTGILLVGRRCAEPSLIIEAWDCLEIGSWELDFPRRCHPNPTAARRSLALPKEANRVLSRSEAQDFFRAGP
jgi:hypothetical protein